MSLIYSIRDRSNSQVDVELSSFFENNKRTYFICFPVMIFCETAASWASELALAGTLKKCC